MFKAYKKYWMGYVDFTGRSTRSDYWLAVLANTIVGIILFSIVIVVTVFDSPNSYSQLTVWVCNAILFC